MKNIGLILLVLIFLAIAATPPSPAVSYYSGTPTFVEETDSAFIPPTAFWWSIYNKNATDATVEGITIPAGVTITSPDYPIFLDTIWFDGNGDTLLIYYIVKD